MPLVGLAGMFRQLLFGNENSVSLRQDERIGAHAAQCRVLRMIPDGLDRTKAVLLRDLDQGIAALNVMGHALGLRDGMEGRKSCRSMPGKTTVHVPGGICSR